MSCTLLLGGARSGKSRRAQSLAEAAGLQRCYIATARALDDEMHQRIERHRTDRGPGWQTIEEPLDLVAVLNAQSTSGQVILVDCLTLWLSNLMHAGHDVPGATGGLITALRDHPARLFLVSNETGFGLVPENALGRAFRDEQGRLNQAIAAVSDRVELVVAGLPLVLKGD